jgi:peptidoglycan-associated lipoprotein
MKWTLLVLTLVALVIVGGCKKKAAPAAPPQPTTQAPTTPPAPQPTASLSVSPQSIQPGGSATLTWSTQNATNVNIDGVGAVAPTGSQPVSPSSSTTYHLTAQGPGGTAEASARLTVTGAAQAPPPQPKIEPQPPATSQTEAELFATSMKDIYFDYDRYDLRAEDQATIAADAQFLKAHPSIKFTIEGHCDERGSTEYNLALGDNRANAARDALVKAGIAASQIRTVSYGKERPFCTEHNESCWQQNRRAHFVYGQ